MLTDSHCHLDFPDFAAELDDVVARASAAGVTRMITISTYVSRIETYRGLSERFANVWHSVGTHPHQAAAEPDVTAEEIVSLSGHRKCVAIGEAGLDFHYDKSPRDIQEKVFRTHIKAAQVSGLPLVIHARDADDLMIRMLEEGVAEAPFGAVLHCFSSGARLAEIGVKLGFYLSFSGILTFRRADELREIAASVPLDRLLVETDAPYLAPEPYRGKRNEPAYTRKTAEVLAKVKGIALDELARATNANCDRLFPKLLANSQTMAAN